MSKELENRVNEAAMRAYAASERKNRTEYQLEMARLWEALASHARTYQKPGVKLSQSDVLSCANLAMFQCMKTWKPGQADFWVCYLGYLKFRMIDEYYNSLDTIERAAKKELSRQLKNSTDLTDEEREYIRAKYVRISPDNDPNEDDREIEAVSDENIEDIVTQADSIKYYFDILNSQILLLKKKYENSTRTCYAPLFYSEFVTNRIYDEKNPSVFSKAETGLMNTIDHDFVSFYLDGNNNSVSGIYAATLKKLSEFSEKPDDADKPCGYMLHNIVYSRYVSKIQNKDKLQSESSITQQRDKFKDLLKASL